MWDSLRWTQLSSRDNRLDVMKGVGIIFVIATHVYSIDSATRRCLLFPFWVDQAVPIFLFISGYLWFRSYDRFTQITRRAKDWLVKATSPALRFYALFTPVFILEILMKMHELKKRGGSPFGILDICVSYISGGYGPGSYYLVVLLQLSIIFPLVYLLVRKKPYLSLLLAGMINVGFEALQDYLELSNATYRLIAARYLFVITLGCLAARGNWFNRDKATNGFRFVLPSFSAISMICLLCTAYLSVTIPPFTQWTTTTILSSPYVAFVVVCAMRRVDIVPSFITRILALFGVCSFELFLWQMVFFRFLHSKWLSHLSCGALDLVFSLAICTALGMAYKIAIELLRSFGIRGKTHC